MSDSTAAKPGCTAATDKCQTCGYLSARAGLSRSLVEVELSKRETADIVTARYRPFLQPSGTVAIDAHYIVEPEPICFVLALPITEEYRAAFAESEKDKHGGDHAAAYLQVIGKERYCPSHVVYQQGHTPKEHKEMIDSEKQQKWQEDRHKEDLAFQEKLLAKQAADQEKLLAKQVAANTRTAIVAAVIGAAVGAIFGALLPWFATRH